MDNRQQEVQSMHLLDGMTRSQKLCTVVQLDSAKKLGDERKSLSQLAQERRRI